MLAFLSNSVGGYNTLIVIIGASLFASVAAAVGAFVVLRGRALTVDAVSHATLPGIGLAFLIMAFMGGTGRFLPGLLLGALASGAVGLWLLNWMTRTTRLTDDAAIGIVLSSFYGLGIVLLTIVQTAGLGEPAGLTGFLLGSAASMLRSEAILIALMAVGFAALLFILRRLFFALCFDRGYARSVGINIAFIDALLMAMVLLITVAGIKIAGIILVVALLVIPAVSARFWTENAFEMVWISAFIGASSGALGVIISAQAPDLPTGPVMVLCATSIFVLSLLFAPARGVLAAFYRAKQFSRRVHRRQGLLAMARQERIYDRETNAILLKDGFLRKDGSITPEGQAAVKRAAREEQLWALWFEQNPDALARDAGLAFNPIRDRVGAEELKLLEQKLGAL